MRCRSTSVLFHRDFAGNATTKINDNMSFDFYKFNYTDFRFILENQKPLQLSESTSRTDVVVSLILTHDIAQRAMQRLSKS